MILGILFTFALFVFAVSLLPLCVFVCFRYARSKRAVIEGMAKLDNKTRLKLGWVPKEYLGLFDLRAPIRLGWQSWEPMWRQQNTALQHVLLRGLPRTAEVPVDIQNSARRYRRYICFFIAPVAVLALLPACISLGRDMAELTGVSARIWYVLFGVCIGSLVILPREKFRKWPELADGKNPTTR